jgi:hypothetical protein
VHPDLARGAGEDIGMDQRGAVDRREQVLLKAVGEMEGGLLRDALHPAQKLLGAGPADLDTSEQIGLGASHFEHTLRLEMRLCSKDFGIGPEAHLGAATIGDSAEPLQFALRLAALEHHAVQRLLACDLDFHALRQRVRDRDTDAVQAARGLIDFRVELSAGVQRAHDHFQRRFVLKLGVRIDGNSAAIVGHAHETVRLHLDLDKAGMPGQRLVHRIVDHLGEEVVQRLFVGAADIHAWAPAHRLEAFEHLDVARGVTSLGPAREPAGARCLAGESPRRHLGQIREQVLGRISRGAFGCCFGDLGHASHEGKRINRDYATAATGA